MNTQTMKSRIAALLLIVLVGLLPAFGVTTQAAAQSPDEKPEPIANWDDAYALMLRSHKLTEHYGDPEKYGNLYRNDIKKLTDHALELQALADAYPEGHPYHPCLQSRAEKVGKVAVRIALEYEEQAEERRGLRNRTLIQKLGNLIRREFRQAVGLVRTIIRHPGRAIKVLAEAYVKDYIKKALPGKLLKLNRWFDESVAKPLSEGLVREFGPEVGAVLQKRLDTWFLQQRDRVMVPLREKLEEEGYLAKEEKPEDEKAEGGKTEGETTEGETTEGETSEDEGYEFEEPTDADYDEVGGEDGEGPDLPAEEEAEPEDTSSATYATDAWFPKSELDGLCGRFASIAPDYEAGLHSAWHVEESDSWVACCRFEGPGYESTEANVVSTPMGFLIEIHVYETDAQAQQFAVADMCPYYVGIACAEEHTSGITECLTDHMEDPAECSSAIAMYEQTEPAPFTIYHAWTIGSVLNSGFYITYSTPDEAQSRAGASAALAEAIKIVQEKREQTR